MQERELRLYHSSLGLSAMKTPQQIDIRCTNPTQGVFLPKPTLGQGRGYKKRLPPNKKKLTLTNLLETKCEFANQIVRADSVYICSVVVVEAKPMVESSG